MDASSKNGCRSQSQLQATRTDLIPIKKWMPITKSVTSKFGLEPTTVSGELTELYWTAVLGELGLRDGRGRAIPTREFRGDRRYSFFLSSLKFTRTKPINQTKVYSSEKVYRHIATPQLKTHLIF
jgi:hypothetical protein